MQDSGREVLAKDLDAVRHYDFMDMAIQMAARPIDGKGEGRMEIGEWRPDDRGAVKAATQGRRKVNPATLRRVAEIARSADRPVDDVMAELRVEKRAAQLWIKRARDGVDPETGKPYLDEEKD